MVSRIESYLVATVSVPLGKKAGQSPCRPRKPWEAENKGFLDAYTYTIKHIAEEAQMAAQSGSSTSMHSEPQVLKADDDVVAPALEDVWQQSGSVARALALAAGGCAQKSGQ
jgi:hypothetical protein